MFSIFRCCCFKTGTRRSQWQWIRSEEKQTKFESRTQRTRAREWRSD